MNWNTVIAGHIEKLSVRKIGPQKLGTEGCSPITPPVWSYFIGCPEKQQRPVKQRGKSLLANGTENGNTCNCLRRGKTQTIQLRSVLVQHFIGWQGGASFQTISKWDYAKPKQSEIILDALLQIFLILSHDSNCIPLCLRNKAVFNISKTSVSKRG